ncbi:Phosphopantothenoylcysteine synthetase/decarboxylase [Pseudomonas chlororaphis subsp. piscium]|nr:Phosphopantothenoylcysteine synthetase/decarboxylase [Pseudomonas chlororaphis subsp. piscium]AZC44820.1 Phosphopantothenoylcysteine synthetase/decarboxylase [Pseudomonas chlororaphis subsp. piscium]
MGHGSLNDLSGVNAGAINAAVKEDFERQHPVLGIEKNHTEDFMLLWR